MGLGLITILKRGSVALLSIEAIRVWVGFKVGASGFSFRGQGSLRVGKPSELHIFLRVGGHCRI